MATEDKAVFLNLTQERLAHELTAIQLDSALSIVADILAGFDMTKLDAENSDNDDLFDVYMTALKVQGRSPNTIWRYDYILKRMLKAVGVPTKQVTVYHLRSYLQKEKERGIGEVTLDGDRQIYSSYFNWLQREGLITKNPTANLGTIKKPKKIKTVYSETDFEKLKASCKTVRDKAIVCFLASTGCRIAELSGCDIENVNLESLEVVVHGKGNKERTVYLDEVAGMFLRQYLAQRRDENPALFITIYGERIEPGGVRDMLRKVARRAGVDKVHPHKFRRTLATNLAKRGMPIQEVSAILGHEKLDTTMGYVVIDKEDVKNSYHKYK